MKTYCWCGNRTEADPIFISQKNRGFAYCNEHRWQLAYRRPLIYIDGLTVGQKKRMDMVANEAKERWLQYHSYYPAVFTGFGYHTDRMNEDLKRMKEDISGGVYDVDIHLVVNSPVYQVFSIPELGEEDRYRYALMVFRCPTVWLVKEGIYEYGSLIAEANAVFQRFHISHTMKASWWLWNKAIALFREQYQLWQQKHNQTTRRERR